MFHESPARGEAPSAQAQGIYNLHRVEMARQLRLHGSPDSVKRASVINFLGSAAGRPSEISELSPDNLSWDQRFECACVQWAQFKTFKCKLVMFPAGANRFLCVINSFACAFAAGCFGMQAYDRDGMNYFYPDLAEASQPSTTISSWLKALSPTSSNVTYQNHRVASLPEDPTAAGIRVGSINEMAAGAVSAENTLAVSGHDAEKLSTLWHYMTLTLAALIPGANVLAGWLAPVYYKLGEGPTPASFDVLVSGGVDMDCLDRLTDLMLRLMPGLAPPMMLRGRFAPSLSPWPRRWSCSTPSRSTRGRCSRSRSGCGSPWWRLAYSAQIKAKFTADNLAAQTQAARSRLKQRGSDRRGSAAARHLHAAHVEQPDHVSPGAGGVTHTACG